MPGSIDSSVPNPARVYDYFLDGSHNFAADREMAEKLQQLVPAGRDAARVNRAFLRRVVRFMVSSGIRQFLDLGSGIPTVGNVHEIAQQADPECRIVYVDKEPIAVAHSKMLLAGNDRAAAIQVNLRDIDDILGHPEIKRLLDFDQPIGLLMVSVLYFIPDSWDPVGILARYREWLAPGSYLAISHLTADSNPPWLDQVLRVYRSIPESVYFRSHTKVLRFFDGFEMVAPGLVGSALWRPSGPGDISDDAEINSISYGGVGHKRSPT